MKKFLFYWGTVATLSSFCISQSASAGSLKSFLKKLNKKETKRDPAAANLKPGIVCDASATMGLCYAFSGPKNNEKQSANGNQFACKLMKGRYVDSGLCPSVAMGQCKVAAGKPDEYTLLYYSGKRMTAAQAKKDCTDPKSGLHAQGAGVWK
jgi:hypothetical protein